MRFGVADPREAYEAALAAARAEHAAQRPDALRPIKRERLRADAIEVQRTRWLLKGLLPAGRIVTVSAPSASGKSTFVGGLVGELTRIGHNVGIYSPEEVWAEDIQPRLIANECLLSNVVALNRQDVHDLETPEGREQLVAVVKDEDLSAVVIDPVTSAAQIDPNKGEHVRSLLEHLAEECLEHDFVIIFVLHDRKGSMNDRGPSADMVKGSQEWTAVPRVNLRIALDPATVDGPRAEVRRLVGPVATNLSGVVGCREALSVEGGNGEWRWEWTSDDLGKGIEWEWESRASARAERLRDEGLSRGRESAAQARPDRTVAQHREALALMASAVRESPGITRKELAEILDVGAQMLRIRESWPEFGEYLRTEKGVAANGASLPLRYFVADDND